MIINAADMKDLEFEVKSRMRPASGIIVREEYTFYLPPTHERQARSGYHRTDGPAIVHRDPSNGVTTEEYYFAFDRLSRYDGPARLKRDSRTNVVTTEEYAVDGVDHRADGPAKIERDGTTGNVLSVAYYRQGQPHREDGPSFVLYDKNGNVLRKDYYLNGEKLTADDFKRRLKLTEPGSASKNWRASAIQVERSAGQGRTTINRRPLAGRKP